MADTVPSELQIEEVRIRYMDIADLIVMADNMLSPLLSTVLALAFLLTCFFMNAVVSKDLGTMALTTFFLFLISDAFTVTFFLTWACVLHELIASCIELPSKFNGSKMSKKQIGQSLLLIEAMKNREVGFSFMKMFILNKQSILTIISTIVVLQFCPE